MNILDINECENDDSSDSGICGTGTCSNTPSGSYTCECAPGATGGGQANPCTGK